MANFRDCTNVASSLSQVEHTSFASSQMDSSHGDGHLYFQYDLDEHELYPDSGQTNNSPAAGQSEDGAASQPKRSRRNRYANCSPAVLSRRRAQNRSSQKAYRQRKDQRIMELEGLLENERSKHNVLSNAYAVLQAEKDRLESERRSWTLYDQGGLGGYPTDDGLMDQLLYTNGSGHLIDTSGTCYLQDITYS